METKKAAVLLNLLQAVMLKEADKELIGFFILFDPTDDMFHVVTNLERGKEREFLALYLRKPDEKENLYN